MLGLFVDSFCAGSTHTKRPGASEAEPRAKMRGGQAGCTPLLSAEDIAESVKDQQKLLPLTPEAA